VIHLLIQACESLEEAHVRGMVHRDIKPANIHVGRRGVTHDFVKVLDFGLVKPVAPGRDAAGLTAEGVNPGTPEYLAPEVARGEAVDGRADLYALGCVGYYMLTGRPVFEAGNVYHMIARHLNDEPPPPSSVAAQPVPAGLDAVILACLRKDRAERPASARDLGQALAAVPVVPWSEADARRWWAEHVNGPG
jgi:serine/threonine-protein kinase